MIHQTVAQSVESWLGNRRVDGSSPAIGGGDFDLSLHLGNCLTLLLLGPMQRSCREPCVFLPFLIGAHAAKLQGTLCVSTFSYYYYWGPCSEAAGNPVCFYLFLLLGPMQRSCREPVCFYLFLLLLLLLLFLFLLPWDVLAAHRTVCQKVVKFGTRLRTANFTQLHVARRHQRVKVSGTFVHITFDPLARFSKTRYRFPWTMPT